MKILILGGGGFIGNNLTNRLASNNTVIAADLKYPQFSVSKATNFHILDLTKEDNVEKLFSQYEPFDEVYQLAADMGGAAYIFTGTNDSNIMTNSALINLNVIRCCVKYHAKKVFYSSSACIYPKHLQKDTHNTSLQESSAYPANPDSEYGWEKLFSERLYLSYFRNHGLSVRIARLHNVYGPLGIYEGGREKAPAAICRKVIKATDEIEIWGDGKQTRTFLFIDDCLDGIQALMNNEFIGPVNIGSSELVSINQLAEMVIGLSGKKLKVRHVCGPLGVRGRSSNNALVSEKLGWLPKLSLQEGITKTYQWINSSIN